MIRFRPFKAVKQNFHSDSFGVRLCSGLVRSSKFAIEEKDIVEKFVRGSGPGGQKINKSKNKVCLVHVPTGVMVECQDQRGLTSNRKIARKWLTDKVDLLVNNDDSKSAKEHKKIRKRKSKDKRYAHKKGFLSFVFTYTH